MEAIHIGPFIIKYSWMFMLVGWLSAYAITKWMALGDQKFRSQFLDSMMTSAVMMILGSKAGILLFRPSLFSDPVSALYLQAGLQEQLTGLVFTAVYLLWALRQRSWDTETFSKAIFTFIVTFLTVFWLARTLFFLFL